MIVELAPREKIEKGQTARIAENKQCLISIAYPQRTGEFN